LLLDVLRTHAVGLKVYPIDAELTFSAIIFANAGGPPGKGYAGLSQVCVPYAGAITRLGSCAEGMAVVDLDMKIVEDAELNYQVRADLARADWHYGYQHGSEKATESKEASEKSSKL